MAQTIRVLIADDELPARGAIRFMLKKLPDIEIAGECRNGQEVLEFLEKDRAVDLLFLDIEMPGMSGIETAGIIREMYPEVRFVFSTGYSEFAAKAFELEAFDYMVKPIRRERIARCIERFRDNLSVRNAVTPKEEIVFPGKRFAIRTEEKTILLDPREDIMAVSYEKGRGTCFYTTKGELLSKIPLRTVEESLLPLGFLRSHRAYLVNLSKIQVIIPWFNETYLLRVDNYEKMDIPLSRSYVKDFKKYLNFV